MTKWNRVHKSENSSVYVYERDGEYKTFVYSFFRKFTGESALKDLIQYLRDMGYPMTEKELKDVKV